MLSSLVREGSSDDEGLESPVNQWVWPFFAGFGGGAAVFLLSLLPLLVVQFRRFGRVTARRLLGTCAVSIYLAGVFAYTMLPLPPPSGPRCSSSPSPNPVPLHFLGVVRENTAGLPLDQALTSHALLQVVFNVVLFLPWGVLARGFFTYGPMVSTITALVASVAIETTQLTGLWGLYPCAYRMADVDDVLLNTLGGALGAILAPLLLAWMPSPRSLREDRGEPRPVTAGRRWFSMLLDWIGVNVIVTGVSVAVTMAWYLADPGANVATTLAWSRWTSALAGLAYVYLPVLTGTGASVGQRTLWLAPVRRGPTTGEARRLPARHATSEGNRLGSWRAALRVSVVAAPYVLVGAASGAAPGSGGGQIARGLFDLWIVIALISVPLTRSRRGLSFVLAGVDIADARDASATGLSPRDVSRSERGETG